MANPKIQLRHDTAANWASVNPVLLEGEVGIETDTRKQKFGDGVTAWNSLAYDLGSTALQSITSSNVTNALGYTPVNKAGDTMSGALNFSNVGYGAISLKNISTGEYSDINFIQANNNRVGFIRANNVSSTKRNIQISVCNDNGAPTSIFTVTCDNNVNSCTFPNTTCIDGQWVNVHTLLTTTTATGSYKIDLSSILPNDRYVYEVMVSGLVYNSNSTYANVYLDNNNGDNGKHYVARVGTNSRMACIDCTLPIDANRAMWLTITDRSLVWETHDGWTGLYLVGYRRIGTNS